MDQDHSTDSSQDRPAEHRLPDVKSLTYRLLIKTVIGISSVTILTLFVAAWIIDSRHFTDTYNDMEEQVNSIRTAFESIMLDSAGLKRERAQGYFSGEGQEHYFVNLRVVSPDTQIVFSKHSAEVGTKLRLSEEPGCRLCHSGTKMAPERQLIYVTDNGERVFHFVFPIENRAECQRCHDPSQSRRGTLVVDFSLQELDEQIKNSRIGLLVILSIISSVFISITYYLLRTIAYEPMGIIAGRLKRLAAGDFSYGSDRPVKDLIGFINQQIDRTAQRLEKVYDGLESKIDERTASLRLSQARLVEEKNKVKFIFDNSPQGLLGLTVDGVILAANNKASEFVEARQEDLVGHSVGDFELLHQIFHGSIVRSALDGAAAPIVSDIVFTSSGQPKYYEVQATITTAKGEERILLLMLIDVSERRKMDQKLERHERLASIGQLAAGVAHEVGNPLSAISSLVQITQKTDQPEKLEHNLNLITYHINRISKIVQNLSGFARMPVERSVKGDIFDIIKGAVEIASFDSRAKATKINVEPPQTAVDMEVRRDQLLQAILNIIMNALDAMKDVDSPELTICLYAVDDGCQISISDNGCGISEKNLMRIFEPFYTTKPPGEGTGLGLSVTYRIIADMGGELEVDSSEGHGTTFTINLPGVVRS